MQIRKTILLVVVLAATLAPMAFAASPAHAYGSDEDHRALAKFVSTLDSLGPDFTVTGETLRSKIVTRDIRTRDDVVRILENIASVSRNGDKVIITNQATITFKAIAHLAKTITFTLTSVDGKPALKDIKGVSVGIGFVKKAITNYSP